MGCLALCWLIIAVSLVRGMQSYGKLTYFITLFPYVILTTFLAIGATKDGFKEGITGFYMVGQLVLKVNDPQHILYYFAA